MAPNMLSPSEEKDFQIQADEPQHAPPGLKRFVGSQDSSLQRKLTSRHLTFIALGGTIGTVCLFPDISAPGWRSKPCPSAADQNADPD